MSRKGVAYKKPLFYVKKNENLLLALFTSFLAKDGKSSFAKNVILKVMKAIELKTKKKPLEVIEKAIRMASPRICLKPKQIGGATYQIPTLLSKLSSTTVGIKTIIKCARNRSGKGISSKLTSEILEAAKGNGLSIKKRETIHKMAESNRVFMTD